MALTAGRYTEEATSRFIEAAGVRWHYHEAGSGEPLICLNSWGPGMTAWLTYHRVLEALAEHFRVLLLDTPGYGKTDPIVVVDEPGHTADARHIAGFMDAHGIERASFIGISQGGTTALSLALDYPDRVTKLVISGCNASAGGNVFLFNTPSAALHEIAFEAARNPTRENIKHSLGTLLFNEALVTDELVDHMQAMAADEEYAGPRRIAQSKSRRGRNNNLAVLAKLRTPVLNFHGRYDLLLSPENALQMLGLIPDCRVILMRGGNLLPVEFPDEFSRFSLDFLREP